MKLKKFSKDFFQTNLANFLKLLCSDFNLKYSELLRIWVDLAQLTESKSRNLSYIWPWNLNKKAIYQAPFREIYAEN